MLSPTSSSQFVYPQAFLVHSSYTHPPLEIYQPHNRRNHLSIFHLFLKPHLNRSPNTLKEKITKLLEKHPLNSILTSSDTMATITSPSITIANSFAGLKVTKMGILSSSSAKPAHTGRVFAPIKASLKDFGVAVAATAATAVLASNAMAVDVLLGGNDGSLNFVPDNFSVSSGEEIVFKNNAGFPHNVVFDEDEIPSGVDAAAISMSEEDLLNAPGETYKVKLTEKGTYSFYCSPHQGAGMVGKVTVN